MCCERKVHACMYSCDRGMCVKTVILMMDVNDRDYQNDSQETSK